MPTYYQRIVGSVATATALQTIAQAGAQAIAHGFVARGARYDAIVTQLALELQEAGIQSAAIADAAIRAAFDSTRSNRGRARPENTGNLRKAIKSAPLPTAVPLAAIGIANIELLDTVVNKRTGGVYWRAQEWGYDFTGRILPGFFQPGNSKPSAGAFRDHPYFQAQRYTKGSKIPAMVVKKPLLARHFLEEGARIGVEANLRLRRAAERKAIAALRSV